jgi:hypothetical protein
MFGIVPQYIVSFFSGTVYIFLLLCLPKRIYIRCLYYLVTNSMWLCLWECEYLALYAIAVCANNISLFLHPPISFMGRKKRLTTNSLFCLRGSMIIYILLVHVHKTIISWEYHALGHSLRAISHHKSRAVRVCRWSFVLYCTVFN